MKFLRFIFFILAAFFLYKCIDIFVMEFLWNVVQNHFTIQSGLVYTIDSYIPKIISLIFAVSLCGWFFSIFKWELSFFDYIKPKETTKKQEIYHISLDHSKFNVKDTAVGKQYIVQLTEDELVNFWSSLEELNKNLEETVSFRFPSNNSLTFHLIGGKIKKFKRWRQNFIFLLFIFGTLAGIYLVITEIWYLITST